MFILYFLSNIQLFPLWLFYKINLILHNHKAYLFKMDMQREPKSFFAFMRNPFNRNLYYHRFKPYGHIFRLICPRMNSLTMPAHSMGGGALMKHPYNTIINAQSIGEGFTIFQNCTIGKTSKGTPKIGNNVTIYAHAIVIGNIHIGNNVVIGAGAVVTKNIPDNCVVIGNPAFISRRNGIKVHIQL